MLKSLPLSTLVLAGCISVSLAAELPDGPAGGAPTPPRDPQPPAPSVGPTPTPPVVPTDMTIGLLPPPPPPPPGDLATGQDTAVDAMIGVIVIPPQPPGPRGPQSIVSNDPDGPVVMGLLETDCSWTNDNYAKCIVWDCEDGVCTEYGDYCVDEYGRVFPCP